MAELTYRGAVAYGIAQEMRREPNLVMLALSREPPDPSTVDRLRERATAGERIERVGDALWIHYAGGAGRSKLAPGGLDRVVGSPVTTRNWRTVLKLGELAGIAVAGTHAARISRPHLQHHAGERAA